MALRKPLLVILACLLMLLPAHVRAEVIVSFYSHDLGSRFPHAFFTVKGTLDRGGSVDANYGFTAKSVTPAILMGSVAGSLEDVTADYIAKSDKQFSVKVSDAQFDSLMALIAKWRALQGKSYNLNTRNCVHFVGEAAQVVGLSVVFDQKLMKKPKTFLLAIVERNPRLKGS